MFVLCNKVAFVEHAEKVFRGFLYLWKWVQTIDCESAVAQVYCSIFVVAKVRREVNGIQRFIADWAFFKFQEQVLKMVCKTAAESFCNVNLLDLFQEERVHRMVYIQQLVEVVDKHKLICVRSAVFRSFLPL